MDVARQIDELVRLGVPALAGDTERAFRRRAADLPDLDDATVVVHPRLVAARELAARMSRGDKTGFVVVDMADLGEFTDVADVRVPDADLYLVTGVDRGDDLRSWSPDEAYPELARRSPSAKASAGSSRVPRCWCPVPAS